MCALAVALTLCVCVPQPETAEGAAAAGKPRSAALPATAHARKEPAPSCKATDPHHPLPADPRSIAPAADIGAQAAEAAAATAKMAGETAALVGAKTTESYKDASAGIDTMMNALIDKAALVTKHWKLVANPDSSELEAPFYLTVRHYSMTKMYILSISGLLVLVNSKVVYRHTVRPLFPPACALHSDLCPAPRRGSSLSRTSLWRRTRSRTSWRCRSRCQARRASL